jgi:hypothetical protein
MAFYEERDKAREHGLDRKRTLIRIILSLFFFAERSEPREEDILYLPNIFNFELGPGIYRDKGRSEFYVYLRLT